MNLSPPGQNLVGGLDESGSRRPFHAGRIRISGRKNGPPSVLETSGGSSKTAAAGTVSKAQQMQLSQFVPQPVPSCPGMFEESDVIEGDPNAATGSSRQPQKPIPMLKRTSTAI